MPRGGSRSGAGTKTSDIVDRQESNRSAVMRIAELPYLPPDQRPPSPTTWETMVYAMVDDVIQNRNVIAFAQLNSYIQGAKPTAPLVTVDNSNNDNRTAIVWGIAWQPPQLQDSTEPKVIEGTSEDSS